jgi:aryl-alcohol dehydrogenase-like predicted oxidoreductase
MQYRKFGSTDLLVSEIGFGAWAIGGNAMVGNTPIGWGKADDAVSINALHKALDKGINFFDTADFYGLGHSESLIGKTLSTNKEVVIATKVGHRNVNETIELDYSKDYIIKACEKSLKRLRRETIDYYQLHSARLTHFKNEKCIEAMQQLQQQGKIKYWGLSLNTFYPEPEANYLLEQKAGNGFQLVYNIINQRALSLMQKIANAKQGIIARMPLQFGLLTGKFSTKSIFEVDDHRSFRFNEHILKTALQILEDNIWPLCEKYNCSKTSLALSYILSYNAVSTVIPGIRTTQHVIDNTASIVKLEPNDVHLIANTFVNDFCKVVDLMEQQG